MPVQIYLTSQVGLTENGTSGEPCGSKRLVEGKGLFGGLGGNENFSWEGRDTQGRHAIAELLAIYFVTSKG